MHGDVPLSFVELSAVSSVAAAGYPCVIMFGIVRDREKRQNKDGKIYGRFL